MFDESSVWQTVTKEAESIIQQEYGGNWIQSTSQRVRSDAPNADKKSQVSESPASTEGGSEGPLWEDLSALANADYRVLISALYDNLPENSSDCDEPPLVSPAPTPGAAETIPTTHPMVPEEELSVDAHFLHSQILPNSHSAGDVFDYIVRHSAAATDPVPVHGNEYEGSSAGTSSGPEKVDQVWSHDYLKTETGLKVGVGSILQGNTRQETSYKCANCDYSTRSRTSFWRHRKAFEHFAKPRAIDALLFCCALCNYATRERFNMTRHIQRIHIADRQVICDRCGSGFKDVDTLRKHVVYRHFKGLRSVEDDSNPSNTCGNCNKRFKSVSDLRRHIRLVHEGQRAFACARCAKRFQTNANARRHLAAGVCAVSE